MLPVPTAFFRDFRQAPIGRHETLAAQLRGTVVHRWLRKQAKSETGHALAVEFESASRDRGFLNKMGCTK